LSKDKEALKNSVLNVIKKKGKLDETEDTKMDIDSAAVKQANAVLNKRKEDELP